jgi:tRNA A37 threonylcarbamoyladenosine synthetase subunit TsaC/SUA5/YrdC
MLSTTLLLPGENAPLSEPEAVRARLEHEVDLVIDAGPCGVEPSTVIDLSGEKARVLREGKGSLAPFAVERV